MSKVRVSAFKWVPPFAQGLVRDLRVRWALEEAGIEYEELLLDLGPGSQRSADYLALQPFGQVPAYVEDGLTLFESGAIVLRIAERSEVLMPAADPGRARAQAWMFAAVNSVEPHLQSFAEAEDLCAGQGWVAERGPVLRERATRRLADLSTVLERREYLDERFTAGDLMMATVLRIPRNLPLLAGFPVLSAYRARCEARPAFGRALAAQMASFARHAPPAA